MQTFFAKGLLILATALIFHCPRNEEDAVMLHLYQSLHSHIDSAVKNTGIPHSYMAALVSLESHPPGNWTSERFEPAIYERLLRLKYEGTAFGGLDRQEVRKYSDEEMYAMATSLGLTQIMGYHCIDLGCQPEDLLGDHHLVWSVNWMLKHYNRHIEQENWEACFRIHNTGHPRERTHRTDYVERGLKRMEYYESWMRRNGSIFISDPGPDIQ